MAWYNPKTWFKKKETPKETSVTIRTQEPQKLGVVVTDFTSGESVRTDVSGSGKITRTYRKSSGGGGGSSGGTTQQLGEAEAIKQTEEQSRIASTKELANQRTLFYQRLEETNKNNPLGTPQKQDQSNLKKISGQVSDVFGAGLSVTGGIWTEHFSRPTNVTAEEFKQDFTKAVDKSTNDYIIFGIPGLIGFDTKWKFRTAWSKEGAGTPGLDPVTKFQLESYNEARKLRKGGEDVLSDQQTQIKEIEKTAQNFEERDKKFAEELKSSGYEIDVEKFNDEVNKNIQQSEQFTKDVETFNKEYSGKSLSKKDYEQALSEKTILESTRINLLAEQTELEVRRKDLEAKQKRLELAFGDYENQVLSDVSNLRKVGVETKVNEYGELTFSSKALETEVKPIGWKVQESFKSKSGKLTWKNIAYGGASVVPEVTTGVVIGLATGGSGALAKVGSWISKTPKVVKWALYGTTTALTIGGVASKGYAGYKYAKSSNLPGWYGATIGSTQAVGEIGGFAYGGYVGTKAYYSKMEQQILAGKYTKSVGETRQGTIVRENGETKGGLAQQRGIYQTKIKGTKIKIKTGAELNGIYDKDSGISDIRIVSQFEGKTPKGFPKSYVTKGKSLETENWIKARLFTKSVKGKNWYSQDVLIKRSILNQAKVNVKGKPGFEGFTELEQLNLMSSIRTTGKPMKIGKDIPKDIFKVDELFRFKNYKGQGKVMQPWEFGEAKPDSTSFTKQFILYKEVKPVSKSFMVGGKELVVTSDSLTQQQFKSIAKSGSISNQLLKDILKDKILILKDTSTRMLQNKGGKLNLFLDVPKSQVPKGNKLNYGVSPQLQVEDALNEALKINLKSFIPSLITQQRSWTMPGAIATSLTLGGLKNISKSRKSLSLLNEQALLPQLDTKVLQKQVQIPTQDIISVQQTRVAQLQTQKLAEMTSLVTPTINAPVVAPPINTTQIPLFLTLDLPSGWPSPKEKKQGTPSKKIPTYIPDFTAKTLGVETKPMSNAQLKKLLRTTFTGLEVRPSVNWETPQMPKMKPRRHK